MSEHKKPKLRPHTIDGIQEYDNNLPKWWVGLFWTTIIISLIYLIYVHSLPGNKIYDELAEDRAKFKSQKSNVNDSKSYEELIATIQNPEKISEGKGLYDSNCAACHRADGGGLVGPNLTDQAWIHGGSIEEIIKSITEGIPSKGMIAWGSILGAKKIESITSYIYSLQGTNPPGAKSAEGKIVNQQKLSL